MHSKCSVKTIEVKGEGGHVISAQLRDGDIEAHENIQEVKEINFYWYVLVRDGTSCKKTTSAFHCF